MKRADFHYDLPDELIAQNPLEERVASRLLLLSRLKGSYQDGFFKDFLTYLGPDDLLVFNNTKVIPARVYGHKSTGGKIELLVERIEGSKTALVHIKASKSPKPGAFLYFGDEIACKVLERENDLYRVEFQTERPLMDVLAEIGHMPLPPYITRPDAAEDLDRYQTVFAKQPGAVAAPTAGLHFDQAMLDSLRGMGIPVAYVTLHVGSGTFQPVRADKLEDHVMHKEFFQVGLETVLAVERAKARGGRVIAIGTTSLRALESASFYGSLKAGMGDTDLFITPGYQFKTVDALLTNFHLPESTLLMLISAFAGYENVKAAYQHAIEQKYRFFSYGDAMFIA